MGNTHSIEDKGEESDHNMGTVQSTVTWGSSDLTTKEIEDQHRDKKICKDQEKTVWSNTFADMVWWNSCIWIPFTLSRVIINRCKRHESPVSEHPSPDLKAPCKSSITTSMWIKVNHLAIVAKFLTPFPFACIPLTAH